MKGFEVSISKGFINTVYGSILFWIYLFFLKDVNKLRQLGSIPLPSYFIPTLIYVYFYTELDYTNNALITILILCGVVQSFIALEFRQEYLKIVKIENEEEWAKLWRGEGESHNVPLLQTIGHGVDSIFLSVLFGIVTLFFTVMAFASIYNGSIRSGILYLAFSGGCLLIIQKFEDNLALSGRAYEEAVKRHYKIGSVARLFRAIKIIDKFQGR